VIATWMLGHPFVRNALAAGTAIGACSGLVGYFLVLRGQVFTGDALSHVSFTGALAALAIGVDLRIGLFISTVGVALLLGVLGRRGRADDVVIGSVFAWVLGLGVLFLSLFTTHRSTGDSRAGARVLFGSIFGLSGSQATVAVVIGLVVVGALLVLARPLLFASLDEAVAEARGVPVRMLGFVFLALVGATAAEATQAVGALLLLGLLAAPGGMAQHLTTRPFRAMGLSTLVAVASVWIGVTISYYVPQAPPSFAIMATVAAAYGAVRTGVAIRARGGRRSGGPTAVPAFPGLGLGVPSPGSE
jgi:zinc/manganese transport system permease protein